MNQRPSSFLSPLRSRLRAYLLALVVTGVTLAVRMSLVCAVMPTARQFELRGWPASAHQFKD